MGALKVGTTIKGRKIDDAKVVTANINNANVPILVACSHTLSISSSLMFGFCSKKGST